MSKSRRYLVVILLAVVVIVILYYVYGLYSYSVNYSKVFSGLCVEEDTPSKVNLQASVPSGSYLLAVLVLSRPAAIIRRNAIRTTWKEPYSENQQKVLIVFTIGIKGLSNSEVEDLNKEQDKYKDLLFLEDVIESYSNLTNKVLETLVAANKRYKFSYLMKCDDDTFLALDIIVHELEQRTSKKAYYWGKMLSGSYVRRSGKFAEKKWFLANTYLPYALGAAYIISGDLVQKIADHHDSLVQYHNEDVTLSVWICPYDMERQHDDRVCETKQFTYKCERIAVVLHPVSAEQMALLQSAYKRNRIKC